jgi:Xaa-Pro dipeptidase
MEDVEDVIVSSGPNTWPNWRNFSDRIIQPGDIVFMDLAALTWNGYKSCYYRTYCVGKEPTKEQKDTYATALEWLYDSIGAVKVGATTRDIALKWPSAMETGAMRTRIRRPPIFGATALASPSTIRRSSRASGRSTIRWKSRRA